MAKKINGITIAIDADTRGVTKGLEQITSESVSLTKQLKSVENLLKLDPTNTELLATKQKLLAQSAETSAKKLQMLKDAQTDVAAAMKRGDIGTEEYIAFQGEIVKTEKRLKDLGDTSEDTGNEMQESGDKANGFGDKLKNGLAAAAKAAAVAVAAMGTATVAAVKGLMDATSATAEYGDQIDKQSQKLGMSAQAYQEWDFIMQHAGSDVDKMGTSMKKLADAVQQPTKESTAAFEKLGISIEDAKNLSQEDLFAKTITALQGLESGTERTALANDLLGKSAMDLGALLNMSAGETEAMRQEVHDLGAVMSDDAVEAAAAYQDSLQNMKTAIGGIKNRIGADFMPSVIQMMNSITQIASGNMDAFQGLEIGFNRFVDNISDLADKIFAAAEKIIPSVVNAIVRNLPKLVQGAIKIIKALGDALIKNIPMLLKAAMEIIMYLADELIKGLPEIINAALEIIQELANGLVQALPELIPAVVQTILTIVENLIDNIDMLVDAAIAIILALADGLIDALPILIEKAPEIIAKLVSALIKATPKILKAAVELIKKFVEGIRNSFGKITQVGTEMIEKVKEKISEMWEKAKSWGADLIQNFVDGIREKFEAMRETLEDFGGMIYDMLHHTEPETGPLKGDSKWGADFVDNYINGIESKIPALRKAVSTANAVLRGGSGIAGAVAAAKQTASQPSSGGLSIGSINVNVTGTQQVGNELVRKIDEALRNYQIQQNRGIGGAW